MGYYDDPYNDYEPTEEDHCAMSGHPLGLDPTDPDSGWHTCFCRNSVKPVFDEPHDEYSGYHANLREEYIRLVLSNFNTSNTPYGRVEVQEFNLHRNLSDLTLDELIELIAITRDSNPAFLDTGANLRKILAIGTHLDRNGHTIVSSLISEMLAKSATKKPMWLFPDSYADSLDDPDNRKRARAAAKLYSRLVFPSENYNYMDREQVIDVLRAVCGPLSEQPELVNEVAALINGKGVSSESAQLALALLSGEIEAAPAGISSGLL